jgi:hypothetical protein
MCKPNEYIYCVDGHIECDDIFGGKMNNLQNMSHGDLQDLLSYFKQSGLM